jgi:hypothetical protein
MLVAQPSTILLGFAALVVLFVVSRVRSYSRLAHIPGPFWAAWSDLWLIWAQFSGQGNYILANANIKYGTSVPRVSLCSAFYPGSPGPSPSRHMLMPSTSHPPLGHSDDRG